VGPHTVRVEVIVSATSPPSLTGELDLDLLRSPRSVRLGGAALGTVGFFVLGTAFQLAAVYDGLLLGLLTVPLWVLGGGALLVAPSVYNGRGWAAILGTLIAITASVVSALWGLYVLATFVFAPMIVLGVGSSLVATVVMPFTVGPAIRVSRARAELW
jgi:hypothetical protein